MKRMVGGVAVIAAALAGAPDASAQAPADTAGVHVVRRGDTLWDLARQYLRNPFDWTRIYEANTDRVEDPHWIFPAERLRIPGLASSAAGRPGGPGMPADAARAVNPEDMPRTVFYPRESTEGRRTLIGPDDTPSAVVEPGEFYAASTIAPGPVPGIGRVEEIVSPTVVPVDRPTHALPYQRIFLSVSVPTAIERGELVQLIREDGRVRPFGTIYRPTGIAQVIDIDGRTATLEVQEMFDALAVGDLAVPLPAYEVPLVDRPEPIDADLEATLIGFATDQPVYALRDLAFVDVGTASGIVEGDELEAYIPPERRGWGIAPEIPVARLRVVRAGERTSTVQIVSMNYPAIEQGLPVRLVAKMPAS